MKSLKKLGLLAVIIIGYVYWVMSGTNSKVNTTSVTSSPTSEQDVAPEATTKSMVIPDPIAPLEQAVKEEDSSEKEKIKVSTKDTFIFKDFNPLTRKVAVPVVALQPLTEPILNRLIQIHSLREAILGLQGHGYVSFNADEIETYYPKFAQILFDKFATINLPDFFWSEFAGAGQVYFKVPGLREKLTNDLKLLALAPNFISLISDDTLKIDLNFSGYHLSLQDSQKLNTFFKRHARDFKPAVITADGNLAIMLSSLRALPDNLYQIIIDLKLSEQLAKFISGLKVDGLVLLDLETIALYQSELGTLIDLDKLAASGMQLDQSSTGAFSHQFDLKDMLKTHHKNLEDQKTLIAEGKFIAPAYQTYLDVPLEINGDRLLRFSSSMAEVSHSFAEQKVFAPGTTVEAAFALKLESLGEDVEATYVDVLKKIEADRLLIYSLSNVKGIGKFLFPVDLPEEQFSRLPGMIEAAVAFVEKHNPKPTFKLYLEFAPTPETDQLLGSIKYNILTQESFDLQRRVVLTTEEPVKVKLFQELVAELQPQVNLAFKGYFEIDLKLFKTDRHLRQLLVDAVLAKSITLAEVLKGLRGTGVIELYPSTNKFFNQELVKIITPLFKNNQSAYERWKLIKGEFKLRVPENFGPQDEKTALREAYEHINDGATPKIKEQRIKKLIQSFSASSNQNLVVPEKLNEILDILSDDRKITDVLKDKQDEGF